MLNIKRILLPLDLQELALPFALIRETAAMAHRFQAEIILLHVVKPLTYLASSETAHKLIEQAVADEQEKMKNSFGQELAGLTVRRIVVKGDPAREIMEIAREEKTDLIVMPTHGYGAVESVLVGSVTAKVLHNSPCPVWTGAHLPDVPGQPFAIHKILCAVDFSTHSSKSVRLAQEIATEFGARLTLAHVTPGVEIYGPGGYHVLTDMKQELVSSAKRQMAKIQQELGVQAEIFIGSGDVPKVMTMATKETNADLLIVGCRSRGGGIGSTGYGIISAAPVPVLSV
jgi:nucleotide-binding universal stress UspA family protein